MVGFQHRFEVEGADAAGWVLRRAELDERLDHPYVARVEVVHDDEAADASDWVGRTAVLEVTHGEARERLVGLVTRVREVPRRDRGTHVYATIEPALAALRLGRDSRIFQDRSVPEILAEVLNDRLAPFDRTVRFELAGAYPKREYATQYRESDFDLVHRLMEEEGIFYWFDHASEREELVITDTRSAHPALSGAEGDVVRYAPVSGGHADAEGARLYALEALVARTGAAVRVREFDWTRPSQPVEGAFTPGAGDDLPLEEYAHDTPITFHDFANGYAGNSLARQVQVLSELRVRDRRRCEGRSNVIGLRPGVRFEVLDHPRPDQNGAWIVVSARHRFGGESLPYDNRVSVIPADVPWRPDRTRKRARVRGVETATVVGPASEEIHTDPYGRVKVQFHWDREGARDERSSTWLRVVQTMGGSGWGFSFVPRIGMEVMVLFVEGDPDRPLVSGVLYNGENPNPYDYPAEKTRTTIKTSSSPGGGGFNELRFEDRAGAEEIYLHGQKDWITKVDHDMTRRTERDEKHVVDRDRRRQVGGNEQLVVGQNRSKTIGNDESEVVDQSRTREVGANETVKIGGQRVQTVGADATTTVGGSATVEIAGSATTAIQGSSTVSLAKNATTAIHQSQSLSVAGAQTKSVVGNLAQQFGGGLDRAIGRDFIQKIGGDVTERVKQQLTELVGMNDLLLITTFRIVAVVGNDSLGAARRSTVASFNQQWTQANFAHSVSGAYTSVAVKGGAASQQIREAGGDEVIQVAGTLTLTVGDVTLTASAEGLQVVAKKDVTIKSAGTLTVGGEKSLTLESDEDVLVDAPVITIV
jgi:type VI secretion system secreted protein VgrG